MAPGLQVSLHVCSWGTSTNSFLTTKILFAAQVAAFQVQTRLADLLNAKTAWLLVDCSMHINFRVAVKGLTRHYSLTWTVFYLFDDTALVDAAAWL